MGLDGKSLVAELALVWLLIVRGVHVDDVVLQDLGSPGNFGELNFWVNLRHNSSLNF